MTQQIMTEQNPVLIIGDSEVPLWGLSGRERLRRILARHGAAELVDERQRLAGDSDVLALRGDHLFDARVVASLLKRCEPVAVTARAGGPVVAARGPLERVVPLVEGRQDAAQDDLPRLGATELAGGYEQRLRNVSPPQVLPITAGERPALERELFAGSYKGVTDLVTKWLWPAPARAVTRSCVALGLQPNHVTLLSLVLAVAAGVAFYQGQFALGLVAGWIMTFLDTVDGKLARVTVTSSRFGDLLDHGLDLVHPPLWYLAWGLALAESWALQPGLVTVIVLIFASYIAGRLCEGAFQLWLAPFSLFIWRPVDSFNRLITARRNPNLILLTAGAAAGRPDLGLWGVAAWHLVSTLFLALRLLVAHQARRRGPLESWMSRVDPVRDRQRLAVRSFTRVPLGADGG